MDYHEREFFIYKIMAGYTSIKYHNKIINIYPPSNSILYQASLIYKEIYDESKSNGILTEKQMLDVLFTQQLWSPAQDIRIETLNKSIEDTKVRMYNSSFASYDLNKYRESLRFMEKELGILYSLKKTFDIFTCGGVAQYAKSQFILEKTARCGGKPCDWNEISLPIVFSLLQSEFISDKTIRYLSHHEPWSSIWSARKYAKLFKTKYTTDEQRRLITWSSMYDNIYKNPDCPHESVIEDDDILDGWLIIQRREREKNQKQKSLDSKINGKIASCNEVFIVAQTPEDIKNVYSMNDASSKRIVENRKKKIKSSNKDIDYREFEDVKIQVINQIQGK